MSDLRLKPGVKFGVIGFPYTDPKTGFKVDAYERSIDGAVALLIEHRKANSPRIFPASEPQWFSPSAVRQEIYRHFQEKSPQLIAGPAAASVEREATGKPVACMCGSTDIGPNFCKTCGSGQVQMGWMCRGCGKIFSA